MEKIAKKSTILLFIWGVLVILLISLLVIISFYVKKTSKYYYELEDKLKNKAVEYVNSENIYLEEGDIIYINSDELIKNKYLDELKYKKDVCRGYVKVENTGMYKYEAFIKCDNYKTNGYKK